MTYQNQRLNSTACTYGLKLGQLMFFFAISSYWHRATKTAQTQLAAETTPSVFRGDHRQCGRTGVPLTG